MSLILPSYQSGFAPRDYEPAYPSLWQGCVAAYAPLLGPSGLVLRDRVGKNDGVLTNGPTWDISGGRYAINMDGTDDYVAVSDSDILSPLSEISIAFWAKPASLPAASNGNRMWAVTKGNTNNFEYECSINSFSSSFGKWNCAYYNLVADSVRARASTVDAVAGQWQHVCWTAKRDGSFPDMYINGILSNGSTITAGTPTAGNGTAQLQIGRRATATERVFDGQLDDIRLYSRVLSPNEIRLLASRRGIGYDYKTHRSYSKTQSSGLRKKILTGLP